MNMRSLALAVVVTLLAGSVVQAAPGPKSGKGPGAAGVVVVKRDGDAHCFDRALVIGALVIAGGRCYTFYVVRTGTGAFLGFGPPGPPMIPPGQLVRLGTPAGQKHKGRLFYLVPIATNLIILPVETIRYVPVVTTVRGGAVVVTIPPTSGVTQPDREVELPMLQR